MRSATQLFALTAPLFAPLVSALPYGRRQVAAADALVLQFAFTLERLEKEFYDKAIAKFKEQDFLDAGYVSAAVAAEQLLGIQRDEGAHASGLEIALKAFGQQPLQCSFNLDAVLSDVVTTMTVARKVETIGVGAYAGAASLVEDPRILTTAASILPIESRHQSVLNVLNGGAAAPQAFDLVFTPAQVLAMAGPFITGCDLGVVANPSLEVTANGPIGPGTKLEFKSAAIDAAAGQQLFCQMFVGGASCAKVLPINECIVPEGIQGAVSIIITKDNNPLLSNVVDQDQTTTVAGPDIIFVDFGTPAQQLTQLVLKSDSKLTKDLNGSAPKDSTVVTTIKPEEASSSIDAAGGGAAPTGTAAAATSTTFLGDIIVQMPTAGAEGPATTAAAGGGAGGLETIGSVPAGDVTSSIDVGSAGLPIPTPEPAAGGAAPSDGDIIPIAGAAGEAVGAANDVIVPVVA